MNEPVTATPIELCPQCGGTIDETRSCVSCGFAHTSELSPGALLGSYRVLDLVGEGGMGHVYLAEHVKLGRRVALKMLRPQYTSNPVAVQRFFAEARAVNRISHENIVEITDFIENPGGANYYIMELLRGEDLAQLLISRGVVSVPRAVDIAMQVASVLGAVHAARIVHRDLKPDNIYLVERPNRPDFVKLLDFGVAKLIDPDGTGIKLGTTAVGTIMGTPEYMSPEQAAGQEVDHRTDIYALGIILYEMVTGVVPFQAKSFGEMVVQHMTVAPRRPGACTNLPHVIPPALEDLILQLLSKDVEQRPQTMAEVERRLCELHDEISPPMEIAFEQTDAPVVRPTGRIVAQPRMVTQPIVARAASPPIELTGREPTLLKTNTGSDLADDPDAPQRSRAWVFVVSSTLVAAAIVTWLAARDRSPARTSHDDPATSAITPVKATAPLDVLIRFDSTPVGATVRASGTEEVLGTTPFSRRFPRADNVVEFEFELLRHAKATQRISLGQDSTVAAALMPLPPAPPPKQGLPLTAPTRTTSPPPPSRPPRTPSRNPRDHDATMDVFDN